MRNASLILNIILLLAVGYLFFAQFSGTEESPEVSEEAFGLAGPLHIVYVNTDTLLAKYDYFRQQQESLAQKEREATSGLQSRSQALEREIAEAQRKAQSGLMAPKDIQQMQQNLSVKQQQLLQDQQRLNQELMQESQLLQEELQLKIDDLLTDLRAENGYDFVLSYGPGGNVLMVNEELDITDIVLERLNAGD
jgi:outer membrane protein